MKGRAIFLETDTPIAPFSEPARDALFTGERVIDASARAFRRLGFAVCFAKDAFEAADLVRSGAGAPVVLLSDRTYLSEKAARDFVRLARAAPQALALPRNASVEYTRPLQAIGQDADQVVHDVVSVTARSLPAPDRDALGWLQAVRAAATPLRLPMRELVVEVPLPVLDDGPNLLRYPITSTVVVSLEHWVHVLWLNQIAFGIRWMELLRRRPLWALGRALSACSLRRERILARMVSVGRRVKIHPTAYLEASILGDDVEIGAQACIRNSIVGAKTVVGDHGVLLNSVVGADNRISPNTFLVNTVSYPEATIGNHKLQMSLIGRGAYVNAWASFIDAKFAGSVSVPHQGRLVSTERAFLGSVVGHRAKVAAKVLIQPGREIPNDTVIVMRPDEVVSVIPSGLPRGTPLVRDRGTLVPLGEETRGH